MANLPGIPERVVTSSPGQSPITSAAIEGPFAMLAKTLDTTSGAVDNLAVKEAEEAGTRAVTQGPDGQLSVEQVGPLSGRAGEVFNRSAKLTYLTRLGQKVQDDVLAKRIEFQGQPDSFKDWSQGYVEQLTGQASDEMRPAVSRMVTQHVQENYASLALNRAQLDKQSALTNFKSQLVTLDNRAAALARDGGTGTPEYQQALSDTRAIYNELGKSPLFDYPPARIEQEIASMESRHQAEAVIGTVQSIFDKKGAADAKAFLQNQLWDPKLNLTEAQRTHYTALGMAALEGKTAEKTAALQALKPEVTAHISQLEKGGWVDPRQTNDIRQKAIALGDTNSVFKLDAWVAAQPMIQAFNRANDQQRFEIMRSLQIPNAGTVGAFKGWVDRKIEKGWLGAAGPVSDAAGNVRNMIEAEAKRQGVDPKLAQTIGFLESGYDPDKKPIGPDGKPLSDAFGVFQMIPTTAARYGIAPGASAQDQVRAGIAEIKDARDLLRAQLGREPTPAEVYTAHFQGFGAAKVLLSADAGADLKSTLDNARPGWTSKDGKTWGEVVLASNPWLQKLGQDQNANPFVGTVREKLVNDMREKLSQRLTSSVDDMIAGLQKRQPPSAEEISNVVQWVQATGNFDAGRKLWEHLEKYDGGEALAQMPQDKRSALLASLTTKAATEGTNHIDRLALNLLQQTDEQAKKGMRDDPQTEIAVRGWAPPPKAVDWNDAQAAGAEFARRNQSVAAARARDTTLGPMSVLTANEQGALKAALTTGDPAQGAAILGAIRQNSTPENWQATMMTPGVKDALDAAARSYEPTRLNTAMATLDQLQRADPLGFKEKFGSLSDRLQTWQAFKDSMSPEQMAEKFQRMDDPATHDARQKLVNDADKKLGTITPDDVAYQMSTAWPVTPGFVGRNLTGSLGSAPVDPVQGQALVEDFKSVFAQRYADIGDVDKAKAQAAKNLALRWGASPDVANNSLMLHPPERYYPAVNGDHKWMKSQIVGDVAQYIKEKTGAKEGAPVEGRDPVENVGLQFDDIKRDPVLPSGYSYRVQSDQQTEAEIKNGRPPSYIISIVDDKGVVDFVRGPNNLVRRYQWDAGPLQSEAESKFSQLTELVANTRRNLPPMGIGDSVVGPDIAKQEDGSAAVPFEEEKSPKGQSAIERGFLTALRAAEQSGLGDASLRIYNDIVQRGRTGTITEGDFKQDELHELGSFVREHAEKTGKLSGHIDYRDYKNAASWMVNTLGGFDYQVHKDGSVTVTDTYDFNMKTSGKYDNNVFLQALGAVAAPRELAAKIGRDVISDASKKGIPVKIKIGA